MPRRSIRRGEFRKHLVEDRRGDEIVDDNVREGLSGAILLRAGAQDVVQARGRRDWRLIRPKRLRQTRQGSASEVGASPGGLEFRLRVVELRLRRDQRL